MDRQPYRAAERTDVTWRMERLRSSRGMARDDRRPVGDASNHKLERVQQPPADLAVCAARIDDATKRSLGRTPQRSKGGAAKKQVVGQHRRGASAECGGMPRLRQSTSFKGTETPKSKSGSAVRLPVLEIVSLGNERTAR